MSDGTIEHPGEKASNAFRDQLDHAEPRSLRTYTSSLAIIDHSAGSYHFTPEGRKLADFSSGVLVANLGHNPTRWWQRVLASLKLDRLDSSSEFTAAAPLTAYNAATIVEIEASKRLLANLRQAEGGARMERVLWAASGSEAIQKAIWAAIKYRPGADQIIATRHGFHGKKGLAGAITGSEHDAERDARVSFISFPRDECDDLETRRQPLDLAPFQRELEAIAERLGDRICCLVTEPYLGGGGSYHPQKEYLQLLQAFCHDHDIIFILDEIQSNFGRTGPMYAFTHYGIEPDVVCLGKGLGNGVPVSAAVGRADVFGTMEYGEGSDTWSANPLSSAAVLATLDEFEQTDVLQHAAELSRVIEEGLLALKETGIIVRVRGEGMVWGIECQAMGDLSADEVANAAVKACYLGDDQGRAIHLLGPLAGCVLRISPPLVMPLDEARGYLHVLRDIFLSLANTLG